MHFITDLISCLEPLAVCAAHSYTSYLQSCRSVGTWNHFSHVFITMEEHYCHIYTFFQKNNVIIPLSLQLWATSVCLYLLVCRIVIVASCNNLSVSFSHASVSRHLWCPSWFFISIFVDFVECSGWANVTITPALPLPPHFALPLLPSVFHQVCLFVSTSAWRYLDISCQCLKGLCSTFLLVWIWLNYSRPSVCQSGGIYSHWSPPAILDNRERSEVTGTNQPEIKRKTQETREREKQKYAAIVFLLPGKQRGPGCWHLVSQTVLSFKTETPEQGDEMRMSWRLLNSHSEKIKASRFNQ